MHTRALTTNVRLLGRRAVIDLDGEIDGLAEQELTEAYQQAVEANPEIVVLNFKRVDYINSTGIALIVGLLAQARKSHRTLSVFGLSDHYMEIFSITRLADFMQIYPDE
jgi:anti-sigma B factor antagonist